MMMAIARIISITVRTIFKVVICSMPPLIVKSMNNNTWLLLMQTAIIAIFRGENGNDHIIYFFAPLMSLDISLTANGTIARGRIMSHAMGLSATLLKIVLTPGM